jgi:branched-chain amino acid transport system permease protein
MMGVLNFAHASFYMIGAYAAYTLTPVTGFWTALVLATIIAGLLGMGVERYFLRRVHKFGHAQELLVTFGLAFIVAELIKLFYGDFPVDYRVPQFLNFAAFRVFDADYPFYRLLMGGVSLAMFAVIYLLLSRTRVGIVVRSAIYRPRMAEALGHNVFVVVVVGGLGSLEGAMIASLLIGLISSFSVGIDASLATLFGLFGAGEWAESVGGLMTVKISSLAATLPFLLMLVVLLVKPSGLKGEQA